MRIRGVAVAAAVCLAFDANAAVAQSVQPPASLVIDGIPAVPEALRAATAPDMEFRSTGFLAGNPQSRSMLVATRFGNTDQVNEVAMRGAARTRLHFEVDPAARASYARGRGGVMLIKAARRQDGFAWHPIGKDEGHGFAKEANADYQFWSSLLQRTLLGEGGGAPRVAGGR